MKFKCESVEVSKGGYAFCRWSVALLLWCAFLFKLKWMVVLALVILALSALLTVRRAPMILLFDWTLGHMIKTGRADMDLYGMRFAHSLGTLFALVCAIFLYLPDCRPGWVILFLFCIVKTISAAGFCPASKLYGCMSSGTCCTFLKKSP